MEKIYLNAYAVIPHAVIIIITIVALARTANLPSHTTEVYDQVE